MTIAVAAPSLSQEYLDETFGSNMPVGAEIVYDPTGRQGLDYCSQLASRLGAPIPPEEAYVAKCLFFPQMIGLGEPGKIFVTDDFAQLPEEDRVMHILGLEVHRLKQIGQGVWGVSRGQQRDLRLETLLSCANADAYRQAFFSGYSRSAAYDRELRLSYKLSLDALTKKRPSASGAEKAIIDSFIRGMPPVVGRNHEIILR